MLRRPGVLLALACGCAIATVALWFAANDVAAGRELDATLADDLYGLVPRSSHELLQGASSLADPLPVAVAACALVALAWLRAGRPLALCTAFVLLVGNVVAQLLQPALGDARQVDLSGTQLSGAGSWPSGHGAAAMLLALGAIVVAGPRLRAVTALAGLAYALGVGVALVALGHLPSDILAAYLLAAVCTAAGGAAYAVLRRRAPAPERGPGAGPARSPLAAPALGVLAAVAVLATGVGKALVTRRDEVASAIDKVPLALAATAALAVVVALGAGAALALRR